MVSTAVGTASVQLRISVSSPFHGEVSQVGSKPTSYRFLKKGGKSNPGNYRPVSLASISGKVMKSNSRDHMLDFLEGNGIVRVSQHGFRRFRNCLTDLLEFYVRVTEQ